MARIVFIEARSPEFHVFKKFGFPRLGTISMGTILEQHGHSVTIYIEDICDVDWADAFNADIVGISTLTNNAPRAYEIARHFQARGIPVMMGGPHCTFMDAEALQYCDYVIRGEGEDGVVPLVEAILDGEGFDSIDGLSYLRDGEVVRIGGLPRVQDLDTLPIPNFDLVRGIQESAITRFNVHPIQTSRGCPFDCNFCSVTATFGKKFRYRSIDKVLDELAQVDPRRLVFFYDDIFTANKKRTKELLTRMIEEKINLRWTAQVRADAARDPEMLDLFEAARCRVVYIGFESINPATLNEFNKSQRVEDIERAADEFHRRGISIHGMFIFGSDYDDVQTIRSTVKFAKKKKFQTVQFMVLAPLPGTDQYRQMESSGRLLTKDWNYYDAHHVVFQPKKMSVYDLQRESLLSMVHFYDSWQVLKSALKGDIRGVIIRAYGWRLARRWYRSNRDYLAAARQLPPPPKELDRPTPRVFAVPEVHPAPDVTTAVADLEAA